ncbi:Diphthamide biosynthesis protein 1 [Serendipita sp. 397]|nr:Diphthamide biosynthesis protein 1 [Serendipita sp. 397]KAG8800891.1 Diphthamide biosynthesis protein 1 [Serendipita sp. 398]
MASTSLSLANGTDISGPALTSPESLTSKSSNKGKSTASKPRKRFVGRTSAPSSSSATGSSRPSHPVPYSSIPLDILQDPLLNKAITQNLPKNYQFEVHKTIWNIRKWDCKMVGLQMPEGLLMWACILSDIIEKFTSAQTVILGDVTYGACCIDDYTALALGCDILVHYGHSCLVPIDATTIRTLYVFVEISIDSEHLAKTIRRNFPSDRRKFLANVVQSSEEADAPAGSIIASRTSVQKPISAAIEVKEEHAEEVIPNNKAEERTRLALVSTIQFAAALNRLKEDLSATVADDNEVQPPVALLGHEGATNGHSIVAPYDPRIDLDRGSYETIVPRSKPLSPGEILGCTAPRLKDVDAIVYLADGRFHLEAIMIANPDIPAFRYDPYSKKLTREWYDHHEMRQVRGNAIKEAKSSLSNLVKHPQDPLEVASSRALKPNLQIWGVVLGTLGRQGSLRQMEAILRQLEVYGCGSCPDPASACTIPSHVPYMPILLSELSPAKLALFNSGSQKDGYITTFVQTSCPRLSIDWGYAFDRPLLNPYEAAVALGLARNWEVTETEEDTGGPLESKPGGVYPMDFYEAGSVWAVSRLKGKDTIWPLKAVT